MAGSAARRAAYRQGNRALMWFLGDAERRGVIGEPLRLDVAEA